MRVCWLFKPMIKKIKEKIFEGIPEIEDKSLNGLKKL
jgi:hypothetical protein